MQITGINQQNKPSFGAYIAKVDLTQFQKSDISTVAMPVLDFIKKGFTLDKTSQTAIGEFRWISPDKTRATDFFVNSSHNSPTSRAILRWIGKTPEEEKGFDTVLRKLLGNHADNEKIFDSKIIESNAKTASTIVISAADRLWLTG